jgi:L-asparaginase
MARVREETVRHGTRNGMIRGLAVTGGVITSAGIVLAGTGHGSLSRPIEAALGKASEQGCLVVRASRISDGPVIHGASVDDDRFGFIAAGFVTPHKARLLLSLLIAAGLDREAARAVFASF